MSNVDKLFKELGYEVIVHSETTLNYEKQGIYMDKEIIFELLDKSISIGYGTGDCCHISMQELKAINMKCEELQWL